MTASTSLRPVARVVLRSQPDDRLVRLTREGGELAFEEIVRRYRPGLVALASAYAPSDRVEDVVQESLLRSWDALRDSSAEIRLKPWLSTIVRNRALNARRDARIHEPLDETIDGVRQPGDIALTNEQLAIVVTAVNALPAAQREALVRSAVEGHTHEQIAELLATSIGGVRQLIYRARATLREGCGLLVPAPMITALAGGGSGSAAAGAAIAGTAGTAGGGSLALKGAAVVAIGALAVGGGVAIERSAPGGDHDRAGWGEQPSGGGAVPSGAIASSDSSLASADTVDRSHQGPSGGEQTSAGHGGGAGQGGSTSPSGEDPVSAGRGRGGDSRAPAEHGPGDHGADAVQIGGGGHGPGDSEDPGSGEGEDDGPGDDHGESAGEEPETGHESGEGSEQEAPEPAEEDDSDDEGPGDPGPSEGESGPEGPGSGDEPDGPPVD